MIKVGDRRYFACDECPICEDWERRLAIAEELNDEPQLEYCYCDKIGHKFYAGGRCDDAFVETAQPKKKGSRRTGTAYRRAVTERKKKRSIRNATTYWRVGYVDYDYVDGAWVPVGKYVKRHKNSRRQRFYKRYSNHLLRHGADIGSGKGGYRRCFDYRWEMD